MRSEAEIKTMRDGLMKISDRIGTEQVRLLNVPDTEEERAKLFTQQMSTMSQIHLLHWALEPEGYVKPETVTTTQAGL